ncbi:nascent polypeptide-associated complex protein [Candidatus Woesearchaeota archaeon]|nr:nascent polypeptide-associated complex protein [Candidatus Woesearchaeota archaeon]MBT5271756.1 nascent polypeptide-associated complex protein [Candidatus Woesearchaeota archaeon]MBT6041565.1 nascent polypeptide-associated complex protein [Candidatus Woesearchaeota archaeon]MBT6337380.1 nascent polypeptide-associated complex protein [Candidatus Woesearchaeota archaeon]MBT7927290.1 nascent polypeptide-associated complex protein [Candidatus Woesearchaeota archaeon]
MIPGMNPKMMKQAMKRMGIKEETLEVSQVIMKVGNKELVFDNPQVSMINMMGQNTFQVVGEPVERDVDTTPDINEDDIQTVIDQTSCSEEKAKETLEECKGDLAEAIMKLKAE